MHHDRRYENFVVFLAPLINSVAGIAIDLYAPSLPAIGRELAATPALMQSTITVTLVGYAIGQLFFGLTADAIGRRKSIIAGLGLFVAASVGAALAQSIGVFMLARVVQGFAIGSCQVVARAVLVDVVKGPRFYVAIAYLSLAFGLGPVIAPFVGGHVQELAGWRWNFALYAVYGLFVLIFAGVGLRESLSPQYRKSARASIVGYKMILGSRQFLAGVVVIGASFSSFLIWNVVGPFVMESLGYGAVAFGTSALAVGACYLIGTLLNRLLVKRVAPDRLMIFGAGLFVVGLAGLAFGGTRLHLVSALTGVMTIAFGQGWIFSNAMGRQMSLFPDRAGTAASLQGCLMILFGTVATALVSDTVVTSDLTLFAIFVILFLMQASALFVSGRLSRT